MCSSDLFKIIEKLNDFIKSNKSIKDGELSKTQLERLNSWIEFNHVIFKKGKFFNICKAIEDNWYDVAMGTSEVILVLL